MFARQRFPFNTNNPVGYSVAVFIQYFTVGYQFLFLACVIPLGIGAFLFEITMAKEVKNDLIAINEDAKIDDQQVQIFKQLTEFIQIHLILKRYLNAMILSFSTFQLSNYLCHFQLSFRFL